jgi:hypothetical protein
VLEERIEMKLFHNQTFKAALAFVVFSNILMIGKYYSRLYWLDAFSYATSGLLQFTLTFIVLTTFVASIIYALRDFGRFVPNINPTISLLIKLGLAVAFGFLLTEITKSILGAVITIDPYAGYSPFR